MTKTNRSDGGGPGRWLAAPTLAMAALFALTGCFVNLNLPFPIASGELRQRTMKRAEGWGSKDKILLVDVSGVIGGPVDKSYFGSGLDMITLLSETFDLAVEDKRIKAVVLRINSPGGGVTSSDILYRKVVEFKEERPDVKVHAAMMDLAASGGYYLAMAADEISAHPTTITGSISVISMFPLVKRLTDTIGIEMRVIKSGKNKDMGSPFAAFTDEQVEILNALTESMYNRFLDVVEEGRPKLSRDEIRSLADGRIFAGPDALEAGLIDRVEYLPDMIARIEEDGGGAMDLVTYDPWLQEGSSIYSSRLEARGPRARGSSDGASVPERIEVRHSLGYLPPSLTLEPGFYYLWSE